MPNLILTPIQFTFTLSQSQVLKVLNDIGIDYKSSKLSANTSINTCYMHMLYLLVIPISKESGSNHETEIVSVLPQISIYPLIRRGRSEGNWRVQQKSPHCFRWQTVQWLMGHISSAGVQSESVTCNQTCLPPLVALSPQLCGYARFNNGTDGISQLKIAMAHQKRQKWR